MKIAMSYFLVITMALSPLLAEAETIAKNSTSDQNNMNIAAWLSDGYPHSKIPALTHYKVIIDKNGKPVRKPMSAYEALEWADRYREILSDYKAKGFQKDALLLKAITQLQLEVDLKESFDYKPVANDLKQDRAQNRETRQAQKSQPVATTTQTAQAAQTSSAATAIKPDLSAAAVETPVRSKTKIPIPKLRPVIEKPAAKTSTTTTTTGPTAPAKVAAPNAKVDAKVEEAADKALPGASSIALWLENGPNDIGHVQWIKNSSCTAGNKDSECKATTVLFEESPFLVTDYYSRNADDPEDESSFEAVRSDDKFKKDNSNVVNYIPKGSLVAPISVSQSKYQKVHIISIAEFYDSEKPAAVAQPRESGYIYKKSLQGLVFKGQDGEKYKYSLSFSESNATERAKIFGLNLDSATATARTSADGKGYEAIEYCGDGNCATFMLFDVSFDEETDRDRMSAAKWTLAISPSYLSLMSTVTARLDDLGDSEQGDEGDSSDESDDSADAGDADVGDSDSDSGQAQIESEDEDTTQSQGPNKGVAENKGAASGSQTVGGVAISGGTQTKVACFEQGKINVRDFTFNSKGAVASTKEIDSISVSGTSIVPVSSWGSAKVKYQVGGKSIEFVKVQYGTAKKTGWIAADYIKLTSECKSISKDLEKDNGDQDSDDDKSSSKAEKKSLVGFLFPLEKGVPCFEKGCGQKGRWFGARRKGGRRLHAASDLIIPAGNRVRAVGDGEIIMGTYKFYEGTYAVEQRLKANGHIIRYGEIGGAGAVKKGSVKKGASIGRIGKLNMLHGEQYYGTARGPLSRGNDGRFWRRSDLFDPTNNWKNWLKSSGLSIIFESFRPHSGGGKGGATARRSNSTRNRNYTKPRTTVRKKTTTTRRTTTVKRKPPTTGNGGGSK